MIPIPKATKPPRIRIVSVDNWNRGRVSILDENRGELNGLDESINIQIKQNGTAAPRMGLIEYGEQLDQIGTINGLSELVRIEDKKVVNYLLAIVTPHGKKYSEAYYAKDGQGWTKAEGMQYQSTSHHYAVQIDQKTVIINGVDKTNYVDHNTMRVKKFVKLDPPAGLSHKINNLKEGSFLYRYAVSAKNEGQSLVANFEPIKVDKPRQSWGSDNANDDFSVELTWNKVPGAKKYLIYVGTQPGAEKFLAAVDDDGNSGKNTLSFKDTGIIYPNPQFTVPKADTSEGVVATNGANINGQLFLLDKENPYRILHGGMTPETIFDLTPFGGGYIDIDYGGKSVPVAIVDFRDRTGRSLPTVFGQGTSSNGYMKHLSLITQDVGGAPISFFAPESANSRDGTDAPNSILVYQNSLWYISKEGAKTTGTKPQYQNVLSTDVVSQTIANDFKNLNIKALKNAVGMIMDGKLLWSLPVASYQNSEIWVLDLDRQGIWLLPWTIPAKYMMQYNDNDGIAHFLAVVNNKIYEFNEDVGTVDGNIPFRTKIKTCRVSFSKDGMNWAQVLNIRFELIKPQGKFIFKISGIGRDGEKVRLVKEKSYRETQNRAGWGRLGRIKRWSSPVRITRGDYKKTETVEFTVNTALKDFVCEVETNGIVKYELSRITASVVDIGIINTPAEDDDE